MATARWVCGVPSRDAVCPGAKEARNVHLGFTVALVVALQKTLSPVQQVMQVRSGPIDREAKTQRFRMRSMTDQRKQNCDGVDVNVQIRMSLLESDQKSKPRVVIDD